MRPDQNLGAVFAALADPTRRQLVMSMARGSTVTATALSADLPMTRQAVAKHLAMLDHAGLVAAERRGRETHYRLTPEPLADAADWMAAVGGQWDERLGALKRHLSA
jgi:DNA-binding transcriptional ArsR family regulator